MHRCLAACFCLCVLTSFAAAQCPVPSNPGTVSICTPKNGYFIDGPVELTAAANVANLTLLRVYDNDIPIYEAPMTSIDTFLFIGTGQHHVVVVAYDASNHVFTAEVNFSQVAASAGQPCGYADYDRTFNFCYPRMGQTVGSPVTISARARWDSATIAHIHVTLDNQTIYDVDNQTTVFTQLPVAPGNHTLIATATNSQGQTFSSTDNLNVAANTCSTTSTVAFCWPLNNDNVATPTQITAAANVSGLTLMRLYDNNQPVYETTNSSFNISRAIGQGLHDLVVVAYTNTGTDYIDRRVVFVSGNGSDAPCGYALGDQDINICVPPDFASTSTSVIVSARAPWNAGHIRVYMDNQAVYDTDNQWVYQTFTVTAGPHYMVVIEWNNTGQFIAVARSFTVK